MIVLTQELPISLYVGSSRLFMNEVRFEMPKFVLHENRMSAWYKSVFGCARAEPV